MNCPQCGGQMWNYEPGTLRCSNDHVYTTDGEPIQATEIVGTNQEEFASATLTDYGTHIIIKLVRGQ